MDEKFWNEDEWDTFDTMTQVELDLPQHTQSSSMERKNARVRRQQPSGSANSQSCTDAMSLAMSPVMGQVMRAATQPVMHMATASPMPHMSATGMPFLLIGLEAICNAVGAGPRTVKRWMAADGFPARRCSDGVYRADPHSVRRWFANV